MSHDTIDWERLWELHAYGFEGGYAHIPLPGGLAFRLLPGAGFGDYSHPTTRLMIQEMAPLVKGRTVVDVGCGSAILSIAAMLLGAQAVYALEIDPDALVHAAANIALHELSSHIHLSPPTEIPDLILIHMISSEQALARAHYPCIRKAPLILTSGLLAQEKTCYLRELGSDYRVEKEACREEWIALRLAKMAFDR